VLAGSVEKVCAVNVFVVEKSTQKVALFTVLNEFAAVEL
jgi:hypothetical protein